MLLFYIYIAAFILGGCLLGASLFLGHHDGDTSDVSTDADHPGADFHGDADGGDHAGDHSSGEADAEAGGHGLEMADLWLPFLSVRFWVFFLCFFGLTGALLTLLGLTGKWAALLTATAAGVATGFTAAFLIQYLRKHEVGVAAGEEDMKGLEGKALLPLPPGGRGKIRLEVRGQIVDFVAVSEDTRLLEAGDRVVVIDFRDQQAVVVSAKQLVSPPENGGTV